MTFEQDLVNMDKPQHLDKIRELVEAVEVGFQIYVACPSRGLQLDFAIRDLGLAIAAYQNFLTMERLRNIGIIPDGK